MNIIHYIQADPTKVNNQIPIENVLGAKIDLFLIGAFSLLVKNGTDWD